ncbi:MAG: hypothetical protein OXH00_16940 [Candidatus Poribacteria bacterium]|nr:hypothetical protein [Candidatus Poribacteria bacterium]
MRKLPTVLLILIVLTGYVFVVAQRQESDEELIGLIVKNNFFDGVNIDHLTVIEKLEMKSKKRRFAMEIKLGSQTYQLDRNRVSKITQVGPNIACICFATGDPPILVRCNVKRPIAGTFTFPGTVKELKAFIDRKKDVSLYRKR